MPAPSKSFTLLKTLLGRSLLGGLILMSGASLSHADPSNLIPRFYEVRSPRGVAPSYLLGTMHSRIGLSEFPPAMTERLDGSRILLLETALTAWEVEHFRSDTMKVLMNYFDFSTSSAPLSKKAHEGLLKLGFPIELIARMHDLDCGVVDLLDQMVPGEPPLDFEINERAFKRGIPALGLDPVVSVKTPPVDPDDVNGCSWNYQFENLGFVELRYGLKSHFRDVDEAANRYRNRGEIKGRDPNVAKRNKFWMTRIRAEFNQGGAFMAVGAGHLYGEDGVVNLLRQTGYEVLPLD